jgi:hypothetical protein
MVILSTLIGFLTSGIPHFLSFFQDRQDKKHELEMARLQIEAQSKVQTAKLAEIELKADIADSQAVGARVQQSTVGVKWVDAWNGTVRPFYAYAFFTLYAIVKVAQYQLLLTPSLPWQEPLTYSAALVAIWGEEDMALFASIVTFFFGNRTFHKMRGK